MQTGYTLWPRLLLVAATGLASCSAMGSDYVLEKVVEISRHGVRPPTPDNAKAMEAGTDRRWPTWLTANGELTGHGYAAAVLKGQAEAAGWRERGLLTAGCPQAGTLFVWASPMQRTRATARALTDGAFPGCGVAVHSVPGDRDPLFQIDKMGLAPLDSATALAGIKAAMGGSVEQAQLRAAPEIARMKAAVCRPGAACPVFDQPWTIKQGKDGRFDVTGLSTLSNMAETFRLAWSDNRPADEVAFGHVRSAEDVARLMPLLTTKYDYTSDVPYIARRNGSVLMDQIAKALAQGVTPQQEAPPDVRWLLYVAHDTNISWLRTMLDFSWQLDNYPRGNIPPAGSLVFERWRDAGSDKRFIRLYFQAQTLDQIRRLSPLNGRAALVKKEFTAQDCRVTEVGVLCPYQSMLKRINGSIDRSALTKVSYGAEQPHSAPQG